MFDNVVIFDLIWLFLYSFYVFYNDYRCDKSISNSRFISIYVRLVLWAILGFYDYVLNFWDGIVMIGICCKYCDDWVFTMKHRVRFLWDEGGY